MKTFKLFYSFVLSFLLLLSPALVNAKSAINNSVSPIYIDNALPGLGPVSTAPANVLQLFTHGRPAQLLIDGEWKNAAAIAIWLKDNFSLSKYTHINIYGCEFAKGEKGLAAVKYLQMQLGISIAASTNITGKDGDWKLEIGNSIDVLSFPDYDYNLQLVTRYKNSIKGGVTMIGNSFSSTSLSIIADADSDAGTARSVYSDLLLPAGSTIKKAFLALESETGAFLGTFKIKLPGASTYTTMSVTSAISNKTASTGNQVVFDITSLITAPTTMYATSTVASANGRFWLADYKNKADSGLNIGNGAGFSIIVVYENPASKFRNITIVNDYQVFSSGSILINVNGISVPSTGTVGAVVGITGIYGDRGFTDDVKLGLQWGSLTALADPETGSTTDAMNSSNAVTVNNNVTVDGGPSISGNVVTRNDSYSRGGAFGSCPYYDCDIMNATGVLAPSATPINVQISQSSTGGDILYNGMYFLSVDIEAASVTKSISPGTISDGGTATYTWTVTNNLAVSATLTGLGFTDSLPYYIKVAAIPNIQTTGLGAATVTAIAGSKSVSLSNLTLTPGASATISVDITNLAGYLNPDIAQSPSGFINYPSNVTTQGRLSASFDPVYLLVTGTNPCTLNASTNGTPTASDSDGDGINDSCDLDDDNDGVLDATESPACFYTATEVTAIVTIKSQFTSPTAGQTNTVDFPLLHNGSPTATFNFNAVAVGSNPTGSNLFTIEYPTPVDLATITVSDDISSTAGANAIVRGSFDGIVWSDALSPQTIITTTPIVFTITNTFKFKYYRIETGTVPGALATANTIGEITSAPDNYVPSSTPKPTCTGGTDVDGIPNYHDLDSDGDGCSDALESGATTNLTSNYQFPGPYGANGLDDTKETNGNGIINYTSTYNSYAINNSINACTDTDGDGIGDLVDIDDDNDGIVDALEVSCTAPSIVAKTGVVITIPSTITYTFSGSTTPANLVDGVDNNTLVIFGPTGTLNNAPWFTIAFPTSKKLSYLEIGHYNGQELFTSGSTYKIQATNDTSATWTDVTGTLTYNNIATSSSGGLSTFNSNIATIPVTYYSTAYKYYRVYGISATSGSGWATELYFKEQVCSDLDTDSDGIPNRLDLDSDGDGCSDLKEAGVSPATDIYTPSTTNNTGGSYGIANPAGSQLNPAATDVNNDGLNDSVDPDQNGTTNYASAYPQYALSSMLKLCTDTDGDGIPDPVDIDDDNDGIVNAVEAATCYYTSTEANTISTVTSALTSPDDDQTDGDILLLHDGNTGTLTFNFNAGQTINGSALFIVKYPTAVILTSMTINNNTTFGASTTARLEGSNDGISWQRASVSVALSTAANKVFTDTSTTAFIYYRIYGDGGAVTTVTSTTIGEITSIIASPYVPSAHPKNTCATDTDSDGVTNDKDLDSDGDGCPDAGETGITGTLIYGALVNNAGTTNSPNAIAQGGYGANGFANALEFPAESGTYTGSYTNYTNATNSSIHTCIFFSTNKTRCKQYLSW